MKSLLNLSWALAVVLMLIWHGSTLPNYWAHDFECGGDYECFEEEYEVFGTWNGSNPYWWTDEQRAERYDHLESDAHEGHPRPTLDFTSPNWRASVKLDYRGTID